MKQLYFVRHGLSLMNQQGVFSGRTDTPLTDEGVAQCHEAGKSLQNAGVQLIVTSPVRRARHSAEIIAKELGIPAGDIIESEYFIERSFGPLEGTRYTVRADLDSTEGVEHSSELITRVGEGLEFLETLPADTILVVAHGAVGRALRSLVQPATPFSGSPKFENAKVEKLL